MPGGGALALSWNTHQPKKSPSTSVGARVVERGRVGLMVARCGSLEDVGLSVNGPYPTTHGRPSRPTTRPHNRPRPYGILDWGLG